MGRDSPIQLSFPAADIALLQGELPGGGVRLDGETLEPLARQLDALSARRDLAGLVILVGDPSDQTRPGSAARRAPRAAPTEPRAGRGGRTAAVEVDGLELAEWSPATESAWLARTRRAQETLARLSSIPVVTVAAIRGACLGRAAELACWCDRRVAAGDAGTRIGFPAILLGLVPGWGGAARLSRIVGLGHAVDLLLDGAAREMTEATAIGLVDAAVDRERLVEGAIALVRCDAADGRFRADRARWSGPAAMSAAEQEFLWDRATARAEATSQGSPAARMAIVELLRSAASRDLAAACALESAAHARLRQQPAAAALVHVQRLRERNRRDRGVPGDAEVQPIGLVGVVGTGVMGIGIAVTNLAGGFAVRAFDASAAALERGLQAIRQESGIERPTDERPSTAGGAGGQRLEAAAQLEELAGCELIIEAVVETVEVKQRVLQRLEAAVAAETILASNTSTIRLTRLAAGLSRPARFCGVHFCNPVRERELVEIVRGETTSDLAVATLVDYAKCLGKLPIVVRDGPGFLVNRLLLPYLNESLELLCEGVPLEAIDAVAEEFGMALGPLAMYDMIGIDTAFYGGRTLWEAFPQRVALTPVLPAMFKAGNLGQKCGHGFYRYAGSQRCGPDRDAEKLVEPYIRRRRPFEPRSLLERLILPMLLEACRALDEGLVRHVGDLDLAVVYGLGFPAWRGGLLGWADSLGAGRILELSQGFAGLGSRFQPMQLVRDLARRGGRFADLDGLAAEVERRPPRGNG